MSPASAALFAPGFFHSSTVHTALLVGAIVSVVSGVVGVFTVLRGQSFAGHAFADLGTTGGSGAFLVGIGPLWGFVIAGVAAAGAMEMIGVQRARGRDLATGIVLGAALGLAALFLYLDTTSSSTTGATQTILFGSIFAVPSSTLPLVIALGAGTVAAVLVLYRPLLLSSASPELAAARGIPLRLVGAIFLLVLAITAALAAITIGSILATALLIGPAATALRLTRSPGRAMVAAMIIGLAITLVSIVLAYDSFDWSSGASAWPVSFFVVTLVLIVYVLSGVPALVRPRRHAGVSRVDDPRSGLAVR
jgi:zinc/manganese transport system permease protein